MRTFSLTDDTILSGIRKPVEYRHTGGGYLHPNQPGATTDTIFADGELAAMVVHQSASPLKKGQVRRGLDINVARAEWEAVVEWVWRVERGK